MGYEIPVALITGGSGYVAGLVTPWAKWKIEKLRFERDSRVGLIKQWRVENRQLRLAETQSLARDEENKEQGLPEQPDLVQTDPTHHEWFRRLRDELSEWAASRVEQLRVLP